MAPHTTPFIIVTSNKTSLLPDDQDRRVIRRHVMKGKNRRAQASRHSVHSLDASRDSCATVLDPQAGLFLNPRILEPISEFIAVMHRAMYPVGCLVDLPKSSRKLLADLYSSVSYARTFHDIARAYLLIISSNSPLTANIHMQSALRRLHNQLTEALSAISNNLLLTVLMLGMLTEDHNDFEAAGIHLAGLATIISLRGGLSALPPTLKIKACRLDLRLAMRKLSKPTLISVDAHSPSAYPSHASYASVASSISPIDALCTLKCLNEPLRATYEDFRFCSLQFNLASQLGKRVSPEFFQHCLVNVMYRLLHVIPDVDGCCGCDTLALTMLALGTSLLLRSQGEASDRHAVLSARLGRRMLPLIDSSNEQFDAPSARARLWLAFVGNLTVLGTPADDEMTRRSIRGLCQKLEITCWKQVKGVVKIFIWVQALLDVPGKRLWEASCRNSL